MGAACRFYCSLAADICTRAAGAKLRFVLDVGQQMRRLGRVPETMRNLLEEGMVAAHGNGRFVKQLPNPIWLAVVFSDTPRPNLADRCSRCLKDAKAPFSLSRANRNAKSVVSFPGPPTKTPFASGV